MLEYEVNRGQIRLRKQVWKEKTNQSFMVLVGPNRVSGLGVLGHS